MNNRDVKGLFRRGLRHKVRLEGGLAIVHEWLIPALRIRYTPHVSGSYNARRGAKNNL
jgi:hypothetical protein